MKLHVTPTKSIRGEVTMPRSKTHSFRALVLASLAAGTSIIRKPKVSPDWRVAVSAMREFGAVINERTDGVEVTGVAGRLRTPADIIDVGNSGTMLFFLAGVAAACPGWSILTGDVSIRSLRTISKNIIKPLEALGVTVISTKGDGMAPFLIKGPVMGGIARMDGVGCQPVFTVLLASALSGKPVELFVESPGETAYIDLLLLWFAKAGLDVENVGGIHTHYIMPGGQTPKAFDETIPLEWSAPGYPLLAATVLPDSRIAVRGLDEGDPYGDKKVIGILQQMGADISRENGTLTAKTSKLHSVEVDMNALPDQVPTIAVAACFARGRTVIKNALTARWKECDRISALACELRKMGAKITERPDGLVIDQDGTWTLKGAAVNGYRDHRMVLALAVAGLAATGGTTITDAEMVEKSFETFIPDMVRAGARFRLKREV